MGIKAGNREQGIGYRGKNRAGSDPGDAYPRGSDPRRRHQGDEANL